MSNFSAKVSYFLILLKVLQLAVGFPPSPVRNQRRRRQRPQRRPAGSHSKFSNEFSSPDDELLTIPLFPLRKTVRLPTERLTLNLYEERYLAMAQAVLSQRTGLSSWYRPYFGAMYSSHKAQIVKGRKGHIVPLIEEGDVGVLFLVKHSRDDMIPTVGGQVLRRRIRLEAQGAARFRIKHVLHNGYDTADGKGLPFIVVQASLFHDVVCPTSDPLLESDAEHEQLIVNLPTRWRELVSEETMRAELDSFAQASSCLRDELVERRLKLLTQQSTSDRLASLKRSRWIW